MNKPSTWQEETYETLRELLHVEGIEKLPKKRIIQILRGRGFGVAALWLCTPRHYRLFCEAIEREETEDG